MPKEADAPEHTGPGNQSPDDESSESARHAPIIILEERRTPQQRQGTRHGQNRLRAFITLTHAVI